MISRMKTKQTPQARKLRPFPKGSFAEIHAAVDAANPNAEVKTNDYCVGYWARWGGFHRPSQGGMAEGWDQANLDAKSPEIYGEESK